MSDPLASPVGNSISPEIVQIEQALANATWGQVSPRTAQPTCGQLVSNIEELGFAVILDDSSDLTTETPIEFRDSPMVRNMPLDAALTEFLKSHNSAMRVTRNALLILSIDQSYEDLDRVVYNVSAILPSQTAGDGLEQLKAMVRVIQNSIEPESWDTEGPACMPIVSGGDRVLVIVNTYDVHRQIRQFFGELAQQTSSSGSTLLSRDFQTWPAPWQSGSGGQF